MGRCRRCHQPDFDDRDPRLVILDTYALNKAMLHSGFIHGGTYMRAVVRHQSIVPMPLKEEDLYMPVSNRETTVEYRLNPLGANRYLIHGTYKEEKDLLVDALYIIRNRDRYRNDIYGD